MQELQLAVPSAFAQSQHVSRSQRYAFIPTFEVIAGLMRAGFQCYKATEQRVRLSNAGRRGFQKHMLRFRHADMQMTNVGDIRPEVILINSSDGSSTYDLMAGLFRLACLHGMVISEQEFAALKVRHTGDAVREVVAGSQAVLEGSKRALIAVRDWSNLQLTNGEQHAFAEAAFGLRFVNDEGEVTTPITPDQLLQPRRRDDVGNSLWLTFNRVQEHLVKGGDHGVDRTNGRRRNVTSRPVNGIDGDVKLNRSLWVLATKLADLKKATDGIQDTVPFTDGVVIE
jgi:hypothetical protein